MMVNRGSGGLITRCVITLVSSIVMLILFFSELPRECPSFFVGLVVTSIGYGVPYKFLDGMAKPSVSDDGELIDGGFDMSTGGICGPCRYLHDVLYITCFVQLASIISGKFCFRFLHLERTKLLGLLEDSCHQVER
ncbi:hypothetical protein Bca101_009852 [Brassica carinata]